MIAILDHLTLFSFGVFIGLVLFFLVNTLMHIEHSHLTMKY